MSPEQNNFNSTCLSQLLTLDLKDYVAVIGSGPSGPYVTPLPALKKQLCEACGIEAEANEEFWDLAERAHDNDTVNYFRVIETNYSHLSHGLSKAYNYILSLPFRGFVTFNYDDQIPDLCRLLGKTGPFSIYPPVTNPAGEIDNAAPTYAVPTDFLGTSRPVVALHGCYSESNPNWHHEIILRSSDYNKHYTNPHPYPLFDWWRELLRISPCLFMGTSLREPGLKRVTQHLQNTDPGGLAAKKHLHLVNEEPDQKGNYASPMKSLGVIERLQFDRIDDDFSGLTKILKDLHHASVVQQSIAPPGPLPITAGENFRFLEP